MNEEQQTKLAQLRAITNADNGQADIHTLESVQWDVQVRKNRVSYVVSHETFRKRSSYSSVTRHDPLRLRIHPRSLMAEASNNSK